jgi:hypothetical protein
MAPRTTRSETKNFGHKGNDYVHTGDKLGLGSDSKNPSFIEDKDSIPEPGLFGIRWGRTPGEIDNLNKLVDAKCKYFKELSKKTGEPIPPEVKWVLDNHKGGSTVYKERFTVWPALQAIAHLINLGYCFYMDWKVTAICCVFTWAWYDLFSGVLHVVHDNPLMISLPIVGEPTLEFQWHHHIPQDLTSKSFLEVCGDLNMVTALLFVTYIFGFKLTNPMGLTLISTKMIMAYFGQLCHAMSHMPPYRRPNWITSLQNMGIMVSPKEHWGHHKEYNDNFCIGSGLWNPVLTPFLKLTNKIHVMLGSNEDISSYCWLVGFLAMALFDIPVTNYIFVEVLKLGK